MGCTAAEGAGHDQPRNDRKIHSGKLKAMYVKGEEMGLVDSNINHVHAAYEKLDFFVVQDIFFSRTAEFADVVLPASPSLEKEGTLQTQNAGFSGFIRCLNRWANQSRIGRLLWKLPISLALTGTMSTLLTLWRKQPSCLRFMRVSPMNGLKAKIPCNGL